MLQLVKKLQYAREKLRRFKTFRNEGSIDEAAATLDEIIKSLLED